MLNSDVLVIEKKSIRSAWIVEKNQPGWASAIGRFCWKSRPWFPRQKSKRLRLKSLLCAEDSELRFRIAARKKGVFSSQYVGNLEGPTFSTQSADLCRSSLWRLLAKSNSNGWSAGMQLAGQRQI